MKTWLKIVLIVIGVGIISGGIIAYRIFTKPHRDVNAEKAVTLTAQGVYMMHLEPMKRMRISCTSTKPLN